MTAPLLTAGAVLAALGYSLYIYRYRELPIRGRGLLATLRALTLVGALLLLADVTLPGAGSSGAPTRWVVLDSSFSMTVAGGSATTPAERALAHRPGGGERRVTAFGGGRGGEEAGSRLAPALRRAAESGAREVEVVTDLRIADRPEVEALRERLGLAVTFVDVGEEVRSAGIGDFTAPATGQGGADVEIEVELFGTEGAEGSEARLRLTRDETLVAEELVRIPPPGRSVRVAVAARLPDEAGPVVWQARVDLEGDAVPGDDTRLAVTEVDPREGLLALVSLRPDWEPRFLLPALARVTGLPARGWLQVGDDAFQPMDGAGGLLDGRAMEGITESARLLVVHGLSGEAPEWIVRAQRAGRRVIVFAHDAEGAAAAGVATDPPRVGEWYPVAASGPLAASLTGAEWTTLPPLLSPLPRADGVGGDALVVENAGGARAGVLQLDDAAGRRRAVVLARGFWRWAFRPDAARDVYDRLWSGVAGWLLAAGDDVGGGVGPLTPVVAAGRPVAWRAAPLPGGQLEVTTTDEAGAERTDTLAVDARGQAQLGPLAPGSHRWSARALAPDSLADLGRSWEGRVEVESHTDEFRWARDTTLPGWEGRGGEASPADAGRPLRTASWPWMLLILFLAAEWILRRRSGLR